MTLTFISFPSQLHCMDHPKMLLYPAIVNHMICNIPQNVCHIMVNILSYINAHTNKYYQSYEPPKLYAYAKGCSDHRFHAPPAYTAQLPTLHQHRANNQERMANQIQPTLRVSSSTQVTLEQCPIQVLTELNVA